jgi:predicted acylesterase/phospholipase RssA
MSNATDAAADPRYCDIVMKGGITSGIVYPAAVVEIAKTFTFKNVGGTSAGAIAAALTAAAERRRARDGSTSGFDELAGVPDWLAQDDHLFGLFAPSKRTRSLFRTVVGLFGRPRFQPAAVAKWAGLVWAFPVAATVGAVPGLVFLYVLLHSDPRPLDLAGGLLLAIATTVAGISIGFSVALARDLLGTLPGNAYGLVKGVCEGEPANETALCTWLTQKLESVAGLAPGAQPLTFGMLWDAKRDPAQPGLPAKPDQPDVNLEMIATSVTWGRPFKFPTNSGALFFDPDELRTFFPKHVVDWMIARARKPRDEREQQHFAAYAPKLPLPPAADLPVIVATRMSLAFPVLLCAVPLYSVAFGAAALTRERTLEPCWFSDGGISSNFPVTLFDSALPRWPTFAIDLEPFPPGRSRDADERRNVSLPASDDAGRLPSFTRFTSASGFLMAVMNAMQNWNDTTQSVLPGYRDRIVTVFLADDEGGLNLDMPASILHRLKLRGAAAGALIAERFTAPSVLPPGPGAMGWENHRWLRFRTALGALQTYLAGFARSASGPLPPDVLYDALIAASDGTPAHHYPLPAEARASIAKLVDTAAELGRDLQAVPGVQSDLPRPSPQLVLRPDLES